MQERGWHLFSGTFYFAISRGEKICLEFILKASSDAKQLLPICEVAGTRLHENTRDLGEIRCGEGSCDKKKRGSKGAMGPGEERVISCPWFPNHRLAFAQWRARCCHKLSS